MFKRKQSSPERLKGRELLKEHGYITDTIGADSETTTCIYNPTSQQERRCGVCADCVLYGYAVGEAGAEKSKVYIDSAFSLSAYDEAHRTFRFNALNENGTMYNPGESRPRSTFGEADHILPQVYFPAVVTLRDPTAEAFLFVLGNILRCDRYGAGETHTGKMHNHLVSVCFGNAEIFSNLRYTQALYDLLREQKQWTEPLNRDAVLSVAVATYIILIAEEPVKRDRELTGQEAAALYAEVTALYQDDARVKEMLKVLHEATARYNQRNGRGGGTTGGRRGRAGRRSRASHSVADEASSDGSA
jgi:CRISPR-associated protein Csc2